MRRAAIAVIALSVAGALASESAAQRHRPTGQEVVPAYEGWERNGDGSFNIVFGTMNRNWEEELHIPIGPNNNIEPGGPDQGQPTYFLPRRNRFMVRIRVPADFGENELVWTVTSPNGKTYRAYGTLHPDYFIDKFVVQRNNGVGTGEELETNTPPTLAIEGDTTRTVSVGQPIALMATATDDGLPEPTKMRPVSPGRPTLIVPDAATGLRLSWFVYRGPGGVTFEPEQIKVWEDTRPNSNSPWGPGWETPPAPVDGKWVAKVTFQKPGTFVLRCLAHDGGLSTHEDITFVVR